jgi:type IV secretory pathway VirB10-like protein
MTHQDLYSIGVVNDSSSSLGPTRTIDIPCRRCMPCCVAGMAHLAAGFGQQRRMADVFHRLIMPDGYSVDLDQFHGLDQIGEEGLKDKVNNHYLEIFGTSIALDVVAGASEITQGGGTITTSGSQAFTNGTASSVSQSATTILDRFMQIPPTITIREGHRVEVYFTQDMLLPAYSNHTIP